MKTYILPFMTLDEIRLLAMKGKLFFSRRGSVMTDEIGLQILHDNGCVIKTLEDLEIESKLKPKPIVIVDGKHENL